MINEEDAINLAKAVLLLDKYRFIMTWPDADEDDEMQCEHLRRVAIHHARNIQKMANKSK
jgi:hypothetical protein